jgi:hypothetical protein
MCYSLSNSKENVGTVAKLAIKQRIVSQDKIKMIKMILFAVILGHIKANCFKLMKKNLSEKSFGGTRNGVAGTSDVILSSMTKMKTLAMTFRSVTMETPATIAIIMTPSVTTQ